MAPPSSCAGSATAAPPASGASIYRASHDDYEDSFLPTGMLAGSAEDALDCACALYLTTSFDTPTN